MVVGVSVGNLVEQLVCKDGFTGLEPIGGPTMVDEGCEGLICVLCVRPWNHNTYSMHVRTEQRPTRETETVKKFPTSEYQ